MLLTLLRFNKIRDDKGSFEECGTFPINTGAKKKILNNQRPKGV